ncbi:MAG: UspA domain protein [Pedosphaera sp.]|nr:UspA domain protein [Pedosphaera sp.]
MKILICSDGSEAADRAIRLGAAIAAACQAEVTLLGIAEASGNTEPIMDALRRGQQWLLDKKISAELVTKVGQPIEEIVQRTEAVAYDLVVIGAAPKEPHGLFWRSSKTYKIIKSIHPAVLVVIGNVTTLKRILICTGGKKYIDNAVALTGQIARCMGATVTLFHVLPEAPAIYARIYSREVNVAAVLNSKSELGRNLREQKATLESFGVPTEVRLRQGSVRDEILREIRTGNYDLVVTGSSLSRGSLRTYVLGDVTREIVNRANCAVLVVRAMEKSDSAMSSLRSWLDRVARRTVSSKSAEKK